MCVRGLRMKNMENKEKKKCSKDILYFFLPLFSFFTYTFFLALSLLHRSLASTITTFIFSLSWALREQKSDKSVKVEEIGKYLKGARAEARKRIKVLRLAENYLLVSWWVHCRAITMRKYENLPWKLKKFDFKDSYERYD